MSTSHSITIDEDGTVRSIYADELKPMMKSLGECAVTRASHVEPDGDGKWLVDLTPVDGTIHHGFDTRAEALAFEIDWLKKNWL